MPKYLDEHGLETLVGDIDTYYMKKTAKGAANGVASLDANGKVPTSQLPGFYTKPASGIPASDLASGVIPDISGKIDEPASEGTSGQVLTTDGNGGRSWTTVQGGSGENIIDDTATRSFVKTWSTAKINTQLHKGMVYEFSFEFNANNTNYNKTAIKYVDWSSAGSTGGIVGSLSFSDYARVIGYVAEYPEYLKEIQYTIDQTRFTVTVTYMPDMPQQNVKFYVEETASSRIW